MRRLVIFLGALVATIVGGVLLHMNLAANIVNPPVYPDTPRPVLTWTSTTQVTISAHPQQSSTLGSFTLQDGVARTAAFPFVWATTGGTADLGWDTISDAGVPTSSWAYLYAVPASANSNTISIRASVTGPATGPTGYTGKWRYLGAVYLDGSSLVRRFSVNADRVLWLPCLTFSYGTDTDGSPVSLDLSAYIPVTAISVLMRAESRAAGVAQRIDVWGDTITAGIADSGAIESPLAADCVGTTQSDTDSAEVPTTTQAVSYQRTGQSDGGTYVLSILGYRDGY